MPSLNAAQIVPPGGEAGYFIGAKGGFVCVESTMDAGTARFTIYDANTGKAIYNDQSSSYSPLGLTVGNTLLTLEYEHGAQANCSISTGAETCWSKFASKAHLPQAIEKLKAPVAACEIGYYHATGAAPETVGGIFCNVSMTLTKSGQTKILSRGAVSCFSQG